MFLKVVNNIVKSFDPSITPILQEENRYIRRYTKLIADAKFEYKGKELNLSGLTALLETTNPKDRKNADKMISEFFSKNLIELDEIYDKLVGLRNRMSEKLNFKNFYELSYIK